MGFKTEANKIEIHGYRSELCVKSEPIPDTVCAANSRAFWPKLNYYSPTHSYSSKDTSSSPTKQQSRRNVAKKRFYAKLSHHHWGGTRGNLQTFKNPTNL